MYATAISQPCGPVGRQRRRKGPHAGGGMSEHERPEIHTVGIVYRVRSVEAEELALRLVDRIMKDGRVAWCARRDDDATISDHLPATDLLLVLGGDGTILSVPPLPAPLHLPLLAATLRPVRFPPQLHPPNTV